MFKLKVEIEGQETTVVALKDGENLIGRSRSSDVPIAAPDISRNHFKITVSGGIAAAENLSQYGTLLDGAALEHPAALMGGEKLRIGRSTTLTVQRDADASTPEAEDAAPIEEPSLDAAVPLSMVTMQPGAGEVDGAPSTPVPPLEDPEPDMATGAGVTGEGFDPEMTGEAAVPADVTSAGFPSPPGPGDATGFNEPPDATMESLSIAGDETGFSGGDDAATRAMRTRVASPDEIDFLKEVEQKNIRKRMTLIVGGAIAVAVLAFIFRPKPLPPENVIAWPQDAEGNFLDGMLPAPGGGQADGGFDIVFPANPGWKKTVTETGLIIECAIGRKKDVPMRLLMEEQRDKRFLSMTLTQAAEDATKELAEGAGRWNLEKLSPGLYFYGKDNGIPFRNATYEREDEGSWFGVASIFLHGPRRFIVRAEVPSHERLRAEDIVYTFFVEPSARFVHSHWHGNPETPEGSPTELLDLVRKEARRTAPATWSEIEERLMAVMTKSVLTDDKDTQEEALQLLLTLRERQALWFNGQKLAKDAAEAQNDKARATRLTELTKAVFSSLNDQRYYEVRKW